MSPTRLLQPNILVASLAMALMGSIIPHAVHAAEPPPANRGQAATALLAALKQQNHDKQGQQAAEITAIEAELKQAESLQAQGNPTEASRLTETAYQRAKAAIAALQTASPLKSGSAAMDDAGRMPNTTPAVRLQSANALLAALKQQNTDKHGNQDAEISAIEAELRHAEHLHAEGHGAEALRLSENAYARTKAAIAGLQTASGLKSGSEALAESNRLKVNATNTPELRTVFARRDTALAALLTAGARVAQEKGERPAALTNAEALRAEAATAAGLGNYPQAISALEQAYGLAKSALGSMRGGQQLVADKKFATPADEYAYEQQRNDDYQVLITGVVRDAGEAGWTRVVEISRQARSHAEQAAKAGDWARALQQIDESTRQLKNVLKLAGFPIV